MTGSQLIQLIGCFLTISGAWWVASRPSSANRKKGYVLFCVGNLVWISFGFSIAAFGVVATQCGFLLTNTFGYLRDPARHDYWFYRVHPFYGFGLAVLVALNALYQGSFYHFDSRLLMSEFVGVLLSLSGAFLVARSENVRRIRTGFGCMLAGCLFWILFASIGSEWFFLVSQVILAGINLSSFLRQSRILAQSAPLALPAYADTKGPSTTIVDPDTVHTSPV
jgi:hypothetical protein